MAHKLRFQAMILPNVPWPEMVRRAHHIEELGFDMLGLADHFIDWSNPPSPWFELWTHTAALAQATAQIRICTCVAQIPLRDPATLANHALTVDHISGGRLELGLGIGLPIDPSYAMMGIENWTNRERVDRFGEYVAIVDRLLSNEVTTFKGRYYEVKEAVMNPRPLQSPRPPIMIAAMGPRMLKRAARHADNWNSLSFRPTFEEQLEETRDRISQMKETCVSIGRDPTTLRRSYQMLDTNARTSGGRYTYYESEQIFTDMVEPLIELGVSEFGLYYPVLEEQVQVFENIARNVIPELRSRHTAGI